MAHSRKTAVAVLALIAVVTLFWAVWHTSRGDLLLLGNSDLLLYFYPLYELTYGWMAAGTLPLWNPYQLCGLPWLATLQGGFFYPPHALYLVLPTYLVLPALTLLHLLVVALATALFAQRAGLGLTGALLAAFVFTLRGTIPNLTIFPNALEAATWLPIGGLAVQGLARGAGARAAVLLAVATGASFLAGYPQTTVFLVYAWAALLAAFLLEARAAPARWVSAGALFALSLALGVAAAAIQLLPAMELSREGTRPTAALPPNLMFPLGPVMGNPVLHTLMFGHWLTGSQYSYGVIALSLAPAALLARRHLTLMLWALGFGLLTFAFALGPLTPLWDFFMTLPGLGWFRLPSRVILLTDFCLALLVGLAIEALTTPAANSRGTSIRRLSATILPIAIPIVCATLLVVYRPRPSMLRPLLLAAGATAVLVATIGRPRLRGGGLALLVLVEVFAAPTQAFLRPHSAAVESLYRRHEPVFQDLAARVGHARIWLHAQTFHPALSPKLPSRYRLRAIGDYEPVNLRRQSDFFTYVMNGSTQSLLPFDGAIRTLAQPKDKPAPATRRRLLDLAAVRFMLIPESQLAAPDLQAFVAEAGYQPEPIRSRGLAVFENPHALPRAFVVYRTRPAPATEDLLARLSDPSFDPLVESYVEGNPGFVAGPDAPARGDAATFLHDAERLVEVEATLQSPGLLVLADSYFPGWEATVDGTPAAILPTNHLFRGVPVPAGRHRVRFAYHSQAIEVGAAISLAASVAIAALALASRRRRRGQGRQAQPERQA